MPDDFWAASARILSKLFMMALVLSAWVSSAAAQDAYKNDVIAEVEGVVITRQDLDDEIHDRIRKSYELSDDKLIRLKVLKQLIVGIAAENRMNDTEISKSAALFRNLATTRRNILTQGYIDRRTVLKQPTEADIKDYVSEHPEYFQNRKMYHYSELIIAPKTEPRQRAVDERLKLLREFKEPSPQNLQLVIQWLELNKTVYGYSKDWRPAETIPDSLRGTVSNLAESKEKIAIEKKGGITRVVTVFGSYPDPIDPLLARNAIAKTLLDRARIKRVDAIIDDMLAHSKVVLYDKTLSELNIPKFNMAVVQQNRTLVDRIYLAWNFALLFFVPLSLYLFFRQKTPEFQETESQTVLVAVSYNFLFRITVVIVMGAILLVPAVNVLAGEYANATKEGFLSLAFLGFIFGIVSAFTLSRIGMTKTFFASRWVGLSFLFLAQLAVFLLLE
jgi:EpsD family peptidyl-prolyl cis-trans isomerase